MLYLKSPCQHSSFFLVPCRAINEAACAVAPRNSSPQLGAVPGNQDPVLACCGTRSALGLLLFGIPEVLRLKHGGLTRWLSLGTSCSSWSVYFANGYAMPQSCVSVLGYHAFA
jgi:hypothetical protein